MGVSYLTPDSLVKNKSNCCFCCCYLRRIAYINLFECLHELLIVREMNLIVSVEPFLKMSTLPKFTICGYQ